MFAVSSRAIDLIVIALDFTVDERKKREMIELK